jgi:tetratricopeptide (TPR) repeat protein
MEPTAQLEQQAIELAMKAAWDQAIDINQKILQLEPENDAALNRLAKANWEKGELVKAKKIYQKVLKLDPHNIIANKNLARLADQRKPNANQNHRPLSQGATNFIEEPGRTKVVKLIRLASASTLSQIDSGDELKLMPKNRTISVVDHQKTYLGRIPDDLSHRLIKLISGGNQYRVFAKAADRQNLEVFINETKRAEKFRNLPSFTDHPRNANSPRR